MKARVWFISLAILVYLSVFQSCSKIETVSNIPQISYLRAETTTTTDALDTRTKRIILHLSLSDGDGDFGLTDKDTLAQYKYNCYVQTYFKKQLKWIAADSLVHYRTPYVGASNGQPIVLKAEVLITFDYPEIQYPYDSVYYRLWVFDRALHKSNELITQAVSLK